MPLNSANFFMESFYPVKMQTPKYCVPLVDVINELPQLKNSLSLLSGEEFNYTTHGFTLLSAVVESVVEEPFEKYMKRVFKDLGLNNTYLDENEPLIYNRAR